MTRDEKIGIADRQILDWLELVTETCDFGEIADQMDCSRDEAVSLFRERTELIRHLLKERGNV